MISYAQKAEDVVLWRALHDIGQGFYIDVGANDPWVDSVTKWFYDQGWAGINVEPMEEYFTLLQTYRPRDVNLQQMVGAKAGESTFFEIAHTGLSTGKQKIAERYEKQKIVERKKPMVTLASVCETYCSKSEIHFLKIDVEGAEGSVLKGMDFKRFRPWILVIESTLPNTTILSIDWEPMVLASGYELALFDGLNRFYVAQEKKEALLSALSIPANVMDGYQKFTDMMVSTEFIRNCYKFILGRNPESEEIIEFHRRHMMNEAEGRLNLLRSQEFANLYADLCGR